MPIDKREFDGGKLLASLEEEMIAFLKKRKGRAFTSKEVMAGMDYRTEFSTPEIIKMSTFAIADFTALLHDLAKREKIKMRIVRGQMHFMAAKKEMARCPTCGKTITPIKTWKMSGRPNKEGLATQLHIGLFNCSKHGFFRRVLHKQKIKTPAPRKRARRKTKRKRQPPTKKQPLIKKHAKKRKAQKRKPQKTKETKEKRTKWPLL